VRELSRSAAERPTDEDLARLIAGGQVELFSQLYDRYYARAYSLAFNMTGQRAAAEEITQEIFLRLWQKIAQFRGESGFGTWFYRLAAHCCLNSRKRASASNLEQLSAAEQLPQPGAVQELEAGLRDRELHLAVRRALLSLKPEWRLIIILKDIEELSYEEIAARLDCSTGTVASRLNRARALLAAKLDFLRVTNTRV
jgi:RNA polymerase sigma-70 factor (ECF subfamily)